METPLDLNQQSERRKFLRQMGVLAAATAIGTETAVIATNASAQNKSETGMENVKALIFDVFGTVVDWRTCVARESKRILEPLGYKLDWIKFADAWRAEYQPAMEEVRAGKIPFSRLDVIHRRMLDRIRPKFALDNLEEPVLKELNLSWHRLDGWKDSSAGLKQLKKKFMIAPCSNGNISLMVDLARRNDFPWDAILGAEIAGDYKPKPKVYLASCEALGLEPQQVMMVAAHSNDLQAAGALGLRTGFVIRPDEFGPNTGEMKAASPVDVTASSFLDLAKKLGA